MSDFIALLFPIIAIISCGSIAANLGWLKQSFFAQLSTSVLYFFLPVTLFLTLSTMEVKELLEWDYLYVYGLGSLVTYSLVFFILRLFQKTSHEEASVLSMGAAFSNSIYIGYPLLVTLFETAATKILIMTVVIETVILLPLVLLLIEYSQNSKSVAFGKNLRTVSKAVILNPIIMSVLLGSLFSLGRLSLPELLITPLQSIAACTTTLALFVVGGAILFRKQTQPEESIKQATLSTVVFSKLIIHPMMVGLFIILVGVSDPALRNSALLLAALPTFSSFAIIADKYRLRFAGSHIVVYTTLISFVTLGVLFLSTNFNM